MTTTVYIGNYYEWHGTVAEAVKYYYSGAMRVGANAPVFLMGDHLGSTSVVVDGCGAPVSGSPQMYKAWGETRTGMGEERWALANLSFALRADRSGSREDWFDTSWLTCAGQYWSLPT